MTTGRINQVDIFQKVLEIELTISNRSTLTRPTHATKTRSQQTQQERLSYHLSIQVVLSQRDNNSIEIATGRSLHLLAVLSQPCTITLYQHTNVLQISTVTQAFQRIHCFPLLITVVVEPDDRHSTNARQFSAHSPTELHPAPLNAMISHHSQQHEAIQFSILPN